MSMIEYSRKYECFTGPRSLVMSQLYTWFGPVAMQLRARVRRVRELVAALTHLGAPAASARTRYIVRSDAR